jgi:hypothetical protein
MTKQYRVQTHMGKKNKYGQAYNVNHNTHQFERDDIDKDLSLNNQFILFQYNNIDNQVVRDKAKTLYGSQIQKDTLKEHELSIYENLFSKGLDAINNRYANNHHSENIKSIEQYYSQVRTAPIEMILEIGNFKHGYISQKTLGNITSSTYKQIKKKYPQCLMLDIDFHGDEIYSGDHAHARFLFYAHDKDGNLIVNQNQSFKEMNIDRPDMSKPQSRFNNPKMQFTKDFRDTFIEVCKSYNLDIITEPKEPNSRKTRTQYEYEHNKELIEQQANKISNMQAQQEDLQKQNNDLEQQQSKLQQKIEYMDSAVPLMDISYIANQIYDNMLIYKDKNNIPNRDDFVNHIECNCSYDDILSYLVGSSNAKEEYLNQQEQSQQGQNNNYIDDELELS